jgi:RimJ/RimL family protein N-acetyltransferase
MELSRLSPADIPEVMRIERMPGYEATVGRFEADEHARQMASGNVRYVGLRDGAGLAGFVILQELDQPTVLLRRIAVSLQDGGVGSWLVGAVMDWVFGETDAEGLKLDVALNNPRGRFVYERQGFEQYDADDTHYFMRIPRERWRALRGL